MDFDRLRALVWIVEEGSISAAARRLCRTQPAVTRMLQTLEDQVGATLVDRKARPVKATDAGERVIEQARDILRAADRIMNGRMRSNRQTLRLAVSRSMLWHLQDPDFVNAAPPLDRTDFAVRSGWSPRLYRGFVRGEFDAALLLLRRDWAPDVPCEVRELRPEPLVIIAPRPAHGAAKARTSLDELKDRRWVLNPDGCGFRDALTRTLAEAGERMHVQFELDASPQEHIAMVAAGIGCSIVPASALTHGTRAARHVQILSVERTRFELAVFLIWSCRCVPFAGTKEAIAKLFMMPDLKGRTERQLKAV